MGTSRRCVRTWATRRRSPVVLLAGVADVVAISDAVNKGGVLVVLVAVVAGLAWVARWLLTQLLASSATSLASAIEERNAWRTIAMAGLRTAEGTVSLAEQRVGLR